LKHVNLTILMHTRAEESSVKLCALECCKSLWDESIARDRLSGYSLDTATFIAECADEDHDEVARLARSLRKSVEAVSGSLENVLG